MAAAGETGRGTAAVRRAALVAAKHSAVPGEGHPAVWQPWATLLRDAEARMRVEITEALRVLEGDMAAAGQVLDVAAGLADQTSRQITGAAWAAWQRQMDAAGEAAEAILSPARRAYDQETQRATQAFKVTIETAKHAFDRAVSDAGTARGIGDEMRRAG